jgi:hypothetical protein
MAFRVAVERPSGWRRGSAAWICSGAQLRDRGVDGPLGADRHRHRAQQLGHVTGELLRQRRHGAEPEVDQPGLAAVVEHEVGQAQVPMGDPGPMQVGDQAPDPPEDLVAEPLGRHAVQRAPLDPRERQGQPVRVDLGNPEQPGGADAVVGRQRRHQRLLLDRLLQGRRDRLVAQTAEAQPAVETEQQVAAALLAAEDLDEDAASAGSGPEERPGAAGVDGGRVDLGDVDARPAQGRGDLLRVQRPHWAPQRQQRRRRGHEPAGERGQQVPRQLVAGQEHVDRGEGDDPDRQPPVGSRQQRPGDQVAGNGDGHVPRAQARRDVGRPRRWGLGQEAGGWRMPDEPVDQGQQGRGEHAGQEQEQATDQPQQVARAPRELVLPVAVAPAVGGRSRARPGVR